MIDIVPLFKALANEERIKIAALISERGLSAEQIAARLDLPPPTVSHHLTLMHDVALVEAKPERRRTVYRLRQQPLFDAQSTIAAHQATAGSSADPERHAHTVLRRYLVDGRLETISWQPNEQEVLLRFLVRAFEHDRRYPEKEVNRLLGEYHEDFASLRRMLVDAGLLARDHGVYWRVARANEQGERPEES